MGLVMPGIQLVLDGVIIFREDKHMGVVINGKETQKKTVGTG